MRDLEARLLAEREEKAALAGEKAALAARLARLKEAGTDDLKEKAELQEALVRSEERRLEVSRALIDFQLEVNDAKQQHATEKFALEQRILELESGRLAHHVRAEDHAALLDERDGLARRLRESQDEASRLGRALEAERQQSAEALTEVRRLNKLLAALEAASAGDASALLRDADDSSDGAAVTPGLAGAAGLSAAARGAPGARVNLSEVRLQLQRQLKQQERRIAELESALAEAQQQLEAANSSHSVTQEALDQARAVFRRKMEAAAREVVELAQRVTLTSGEPGHQLAVSPEELLSSMQAYLEQLVQVCHDSVGEARRDAEALWERHTTLRRRARQLYSGYRALRYKLADEWPPGGGTAPPRVPHEDAVCGGSMGDVIRADDEADRQALVRQQNKVAALEAQLAALKVRQLELDTLGQAARGAPRLDQLGSKARQARSGLAGADGLSASAATTLQLENSRLREEVDSLKRRLPALGLLRRSGSNLQQQPHAPQAAALEQMSGELSQLRAENQCLRAAAAAAAAGGGPGQPAAAPAPAAPPGVGVEAASAVLGRQLKEFTLSTQLDLERRLKHWEARAVMAEEQLAHLQRYIAAAQVAFHREAARLYTALKALDPSAQPPVLSVQQPGGVAGALL